MSNTHYRTCNLCEAMCGIAVEHDDENVAAIRGDDHDVLSSGHICPKAVALADLHDDPDRLRKPQRRVRQQWIDCEWDDALSDIAQRIVEIQRRHGRNAVAIYVGNPTIHNLGSTLFGIGVEKAVGTRNRYSATSVDQLPHMLANLSMFGHQVLFPVPDLDRTDLFVVFGGNPLVSNGSLMSAGDPPGRLKAIQKRGGRIVVIDPRRTRTAELADQHIFVRPGGDAALLAALLHTMFDEGLADPGRVGRFTDGMATLGTLVGPFAPERVQAATGIAPPQVRQLARDIAAADRAAVYGRVGICTQPFGALAAWLLHAISVVTGNLDREGGMMFARPAVDLVRLASMLGMRGHFDRGRSRVRGLPEFGGEYPVVTLADEIETPGEGQIRALITMAGNPVLSTPNGRRLERLLPNLELMVSLDIYRNETSRHAHYILPPTSQLEQSHYDLALHALAVRNTAKYSPPLFEPPAGAKHDWQIQLELATRIIEARGGLGALSGRLFRALLGRVGPDGLLDLGLRLGPHGAGLGRRASADSREGLTLARLKTFAHGIDLGPLEPCLPERLHTLERRIRLAPAVYHTELDRLARWVDEQRPDGLLLIGRRQLRSNNSWLHNSARMMKGRDRCTLRMHPDDARARGLNDGARVRLSSRAGSIEAPLELSDEMMPGVVCMPHGFGHDRPGVRLAVASAHAGASMNDVVDEQLHDGLTGTAALNAVPVEVQPVATTADHRPSAESTP